MRALHGFAVALALLVAAPAAAVAQDDEFSDADGELDMAPDDFGDVEDDVPAGPQEGGDEDPTEARLAAEKEARAKKKAETPPPPTTRAGYPIEPVARPIVLPRNMGEARYEARITPDPLVFGGFVEAFWGVTDQVQIGLAYGTGTFGDSPSGESSYEVGKAISVEGVYLFNQYFGLQVELPIYVDPFALALTLGPRFEYQFGDKLRFVTGEDFLTIRLVKFAPSLDNALTNANLARDVARNTNVSRGALRFPLTVIYQENTNLSFAARTSVTFDDFDDSKGALAMEGVVNYAFTNKFDIGGRLGFLDLKDAAETFGLTAYVELRL